MGFMGYRPEPLHWLRVAMATATEELATLTSADPAATAEMGTIRSISSLLADTWQPLLASIESCVALVDHRRVGLDQTDLRLVPFVGGGWTIMTDSLAPFDMGITTAEATALGHALSTGDLDDWLDSDGELGWLAAQLQAVVVDRVALRAFAQAFTGGIDAWARLLDALAARYIELGSTSPSREARTTLALLDDVLAGAAAVYRTVPTDAHVGWFPTVIRHVDPYSAALLLRGLDLDSRTLAVACADILRRRDDGPEGGGGWYDQAAWGDNAADILFRLLAADPAAATDFLTIVEPAALFTGASDQSALRAMLSAGTDPATVDAATAGRIVPFLLDWLRGSDEQLGSTGDGDPQSIHELAVTLLSPWLVDALTGADEWNWSQDEGAETLRWVIGDSDGMLAMTVALQAWQERLLTTPMVRADGTVDVALIDDLAATFVGLQVALRDEEVDDAIEARLFVDLAIQIGSAIADDSAPGGPFGSFAMTEILLPESIAALEETGILPPDEDEARAMAASRFGSRITDVAVVAVVAAVGQMIAVGRVPAGSLGSLDLSGLTRGCPATEIQARLDDFVEQLDCDEPTRGQLSAVSHAFLNASGAELVCEMTG